MKCPECGGRLLRIRGSVAKNHGLYECMDKNEYIPFGKERKKKCNFKGYLREDK